MKKYVYILMSTGIFVVDEDATGELKVKTVKYFKGLMQVHNQLLLLHEPSPHTHDAAQDASRTLGTPDGAQKNQ